MIPFLYAAWQKIHDQPFDYAVLALLALMGLICTLYTIKARRMQRSPEPSALLPPSVRPVSASEPVINRPADRAELEIRFYEGWPSCNIGVYNKSGLNAAQNVEVWIERITGPSLPYAVNSLLPHRLRTRDGKERHYDINPDTEEVFEFSTASGNDPKNKGVEFQLSALRLDPRKNTRAESEHIVLRLGEHLHIHIKVSCANADSQRAIFYAFPRHPTIGLGVEVARIY